MATNKKSATFSKATLDLFDKLISSVPDLERKGDTVPYTSLNGHMFSYMGKDGKLALRLPKEKLEEFLKMYNTTNAASYGVMQKEYVAVPDALLKKTAELKPYFRASYEYVGGLKPKATTRPKKK